MFVSQLQVQNRPGFTAVISSLSYLGDCQLTYCLRETQTGISFMRNNSPVFVAGLVEPRVRVLGASGSAELSGRSASSGLAVLARIDC